MHVPHLLTFVGILLILILSSSTAANSQSSSSITWEVQFNTSTSIFHSIGMCKGTSDTTSKVGFVGGELGAIWRTLDGKNWQQVRQYSSASWYGIYCFPDAQRVIAVGFSGGGGAITWSFDGGNTWTDQLSMHHAGMVLQSVQFYNDTHGIILPSVQGKANVVYYTTNGGKTASDWNVGKFTGQPSWTQNHAVWMFDNVTVSFAQDYNKGPQLCSSDDLGESWNCDSIPQGVTDGSYTTPNDAVGVDFGFNIYSTQDGGSNWTWISAIPTDLSRAMTFPTDMVWIPNSAVTILVGGNNYLSYTGTVAHSLNGGFNWVESIPLLPPTFFTSIDSVTFSKRTTEVWTVGGTGASTGIILHATVIQEP